jgi:RND superfamily putative drug exporter
VETACPRTPSRPGSPTTPAGRFTDADLATVNAVAAQLATRLGQRVGPAQLSRDGQAAIVALPIRTAADNAGNVETVTALRAEIADSRQLADAGVTVEVTGGPAFGADIASAFDGANLTLLLVTVAVVAVLLLLTYRSPVLWLVPLSVVAVADQVAGRVTAWLGQLTGLNFDAGIVSVLVFGAGTNYALLLISRYREELAAEADHRSALVRAWTASVPAIVASNVTVVLALLTLLAASVPGTRGLGLASAAGLLVALAAVLLVLPGALAMCGRRVFWPFVPRPGTAADSGPGRWAGVARGVVHRPAAVLTAGLALLAVAAGPLLATSVGLSQADAFRGHSESAAGLATMSAHFPAGETAPFDVLSDAAHAPAVTRALEQVPGVVRVHIPGSAQDGSAQTGSAQTGSGAAPVRISVVGAPAPDTEQSLQLAQDLRAAVASVPGADAAVGGASAQTFDARTAAWRDLRVIVPLVLTVNALVLLVLLRSVVAPVALMVLNVASALGSLGLGAWLSRTVLGFPALDSAVPLISFLFLVALGIDYTIFLVHRARAEAQIRGTVDGTVWAVGRTGTVITSAGVVLAGVFAALGVLPLVVLAQLGLIVGLGVLVDTLLVRTALVPAVVALLGDRFWWPSAVPSRP